MTAHSTFLRLAVAAGLVSAVAAQTLGADFAPGYTITGLEAVPGVPPNYGGITFGPNPMVLVINGDANAHASAMYQIYVTRDAAGHVNGYEGTATLLATAPDADGGLEYTSTGVLLYTTWPTGTLGQIKPGSTSPDRIVELGPLGVPGSTGGLRITPTGFPLAGKLRITSYDGGTWSSADLVPDGDGTYDVVNVEHAATIPSPCGWAAPTAGAESVIYVDSSYPGFTAQGVLVCDWDCREVSAYALDAQGDVDVQVHRRAFLHGYHCSGATIDPLTGDFLFADFNGTGLIVVRPRTAFGAACGGLALDSTKPRLGASMFLGTTRYPSGSTLGLQTLGFQRLDPAVDLSGLGMAGCFQHASVDAALVVVPAGGVSIVQVFVPSNPGLLGLLLVGQSYALAPGINAAGAVSSNGIVTTVGN